MEERTFQRFIDKVDKTDHQRCKAHGCWIWTAGLHHNGYGAFGMNGKMVKAHRFSYEHFKGAIPDGLVVMHQCPYEEGDRDNRRCVNPEHLKAGTQRQNIRDGYKNGRRKNDHCPKCGGDYTTFKSGQRRCKPCHSAYVRRRKKQLTTSETST